MPHILGCFPGYCLLAPLPHQSVQWQWSLLIPRWRLNAGCLGVVGAVPYPHPVSHTCNSIHAHRFKHRPRTHESCLAFSHPYPACLHTEHNYPQILSPILVHSLPQSLKNFYFFCISLVRLWLIIINTNLVFVTSPGTELLTLWELTWIKLSYYVNEVTFGKPLSHLRMGAGCQGTQLCVSPTPGPPRRGERLKVESITNSQWVNQSCLCSKDSIRKKTIGQGSESFQAVNTWRFGGGDAWRGHGTLCPFPIPGPTHLFHLAAPELYPLQTSDLASKLSLWVLWAILANRSNPRMGWWQPLICSPLSVRSPGEVRRGSLAGQSPYLWDLTLSPVRWCQICLLVGVENPHVRPKIKFVDF